MSTVFDPATGAAFSSTGAAGVSTAVSAGGAAGAVVGTTSGASDAIVDGMGWDGIRERVYVRKRSGYHEKRREDLQRSDEKGEVG